MTRLPLISARDSGEFVARLWEGILWELQKGVGCCGVVRPDQELDLSRPSGDRRCATGVPARAVAVAC